MRALRYILAVPLCTAPQGIGVRALTQRPCPFIYLEGWDELLALPLLKLSSHLHLVLYHGAHPSPEVRYKTRFWLALVHSSSVYPGVPRGLLLSSPQL